MHTEQLNNVFGALADPVRRRIVEHLRDKEHTVAELAALFDISLPAISRHLKVLHNAQLLERHKSGKYIICSYNPEPCNEAMKWITEQHRFWNESFKALESFLDNDINQK